ncbi:MAG TPA: RecQ family ATP-dependent DNA helicase, partial [Chroococcidiopsis sp.]
DVPVMALTATATERVRHDIIQQLGLRQPHIHISSFNRQNLYYDVRPKQKHAYLDLLQMIRQTPGSGIVYCLSRKKVDEITFRLQQDGIEALAYHAGMSDGDRRDNQTRFIRDDVRVMVATIAFGMGINKPDVRFVIHYDLPRNLESYYQESGRAGRDSEPAKCTLLFSYGDVRSIDYLIAQKVDRQTGAPLEDEQQIARQQLRQVLDYAEGTDCRRRIQLAYFGERFEGNCGNCDNCLSPRPEQDWTVEAQKFLSCVARCKERFGMKYIVDVLRGSKDKRILQNGHNELSTYGIGRDRPADDWRLLGRSLLHQGLLDETSDGYSILRLNALSWEVLRSQRTVKIRVSQDTAAAGSGTALPSTELALLLEQLRSLRKEIADENGVPPYMIFSDATLRQMADKQPQNLDEFAKISGVGSYKRDQYGPRFIEPIRQFCQEHGMTLRGQGAIAIPTLPPVSNTAISDTHLQTLALHQRGLPPFEIAKARGLTINTIFDHLGLLLEGGQPVDLDSLVPTERQATIQTAIATVGDTSLKAIREHLGDTYDYIEIRLVRAHWRSQHRQTLKPKDRQEI